MEGCVLKCLQGLHEPIPLPHNTPVKLGRTPQTRIGDPRCSRQQVQVEANWKTSEIKVTQLGANISAIDGRDLVRGETVNMLPDSTLFILKGMFPHKVVFNEGDTSSERLTDNVSNGDELMETNLPEKAGVKRSAEMENGVDDECSPAKRHKKAYEGKDKRKENGLDDEFLPAKKHKKAYQEKDKRKTSISEDNTTHESDEEKTKPLKEKRKSDDTPKESSSKKSKKHTENEKASDKKMTDFFSGKKGSSDKSEQNHDDRESKKEKGLHTSSRDKHSKYTEHRSKAEKRNDAKTERKSSMDSKGRNSIDSESKDSSDTIHKKDSEMKSKTKVAPDKTKQCSDAKSKSTPDGKSDSDAKRKSSLDSKRKSSSDFKKESRVKAQHGVSDDEEEEAHVMLVSEKLQQLKGRGKTQKAHSGDQAAAFTSSKSSVSSTEKKKNVTESFVKCKTGKPTATSSWDSVDEKLCIFTAEGVYASEKIAGFDIDGTIITTQSGRVFPKDMTDWKIWMPEVFGKLKHLIAAKYKIVFFTNQLGVGRGKIKLDDLKDKFEKVVHKLQVPVQIFISTGGGSFRKPAIGMWQTLKKQKNDGIPINMEYSFYVGDAAGRHENWAPKKKKDFSCSDRLFAINVGLKFHTPEEFFLGYKPALFSLPEFDPRTVSVDTPLLQGDETLTSDSQEVVVLVGLQASGKSSFSKTHLIPKGYVHINQDTLKTWQKCVSECTKALSAGKNVVIDNTNVDPETRARYIDCAKKAKVPCRCFYFNYTVSQCRHNERFREIVNREHKPINEQIFNSTKNKFKEPQVSEGFSKVIKVNFVPNFPDRLHEKIFRQFLLEK